MSISRHTVGKPAAEKRCARRSGNGLPPVVRWGRTEYVRHCHSRGALSSAPFFMMVKTEPVVPLLRPQVFIFVSKRRRFARAFARVWAAVCQ